MRRLTAPALALAAAAALLVAAGAYWVRRDVLDSERFARHAREALGSAAVRTLVTDELTDRVIARLPVATADVSDQIGREIEAVVASDAFADAFELGVAEVHRAFVRGDAGRHLLDLSGAEMMVRDAVGRVDPRLADFVSAGVLAAVNVGEEGDFPDLSALNDAVDRLLGLSVVSAMGLAALALLLAAERHRVAVAGGFGLAAGALLMFAVAAAFPGAAASRADSPLARDAVRAIAEEMVSSLRFEAAALAVLGVVVVLVGVAWGRRPAYARVV